MLKQTDHGFGKAILTIQNPLLMTSVANVCNKKCGAVRLGTVWCGMVWWGMVR